MVDAVRERDPGFNPYSLPGDPPVVASVVDRFKRVPRDDLWFIEVYLLASPQAKEETESSSKSAQRVRNTIIMRTRFPAMKATNTYHGYVRYAVIGPFTCERVLEILSTFQKGHRGLKSRLNYTQEVLTQEDVLIWMKED